MYAYVYIYTCIHICIHIHMHKILSIFGAPEVHREATADLGLCADDEPPLEQLSVKALHKLVIHEVRDFQHRSFTYRERTFLKHD